MIEADEMEMCVCGSDLAVTKARQGTPLCASCVAEWAAAHPEPEPEPLSPELAALEQWARAHGWKALHLTGWIMGPEGEAGWQVFLRHPGNAHLWPLALAKAGLAVSAAM